MFTILIIDDSALFRHALKKTLQSRFPYVSIEEASDGVEGLKKADACQPELIFMDIQLPGLDGFYLTRKIKDKNVKTIIAVITINNMPEYRKAAFAAGADHFGSKGSLNRNDIVAIVESTLSTWGYDDRGMDREKRLAFGGLHPGEFGLNGFF